MLETLHNVCLLATNHNVCKAYLAKLNQLGVWPEQIVYFRRASENQIKFRVRRALKTIRNTLTSGSLVQPHTSRLRHSLSDFCNNHDFVLPDYSNTIKKLVEGHSSVRHVTASHINDNIVIQAVANCSQPFVIFCGGGILRREILSLPKRFIHIHPGVVPDIKGADGILWSTLVRQRVGMSAFFMNEGIDTGDIIRTQEYDIPRLGDQHVFAGNELKIADFIVKEVDPIFRADLLGKLLLSDRDPNAWNYSKQDPAEGKTYYFMHAQLKKLAARNWCPDSQGTASRT